MSTAIPTKGHQDLAHSIQELVQRVTQVEDRIETVVVSLETSKSQRFKEFQSSSQIESRHFDKTIEVHTYENYHLLYRSNFPHIYFRELIQSLSIPGIKFLVGKSQSWFHSCLWFVIHILALLMSLFLIKQEHDRWQNSPVVIIPTSNVTFINEVPFPAITICFLPTLKNDFNYTGLLEKCFLYNSNNSVDDKFNDECSLEEKVSLAVTSMICSPTVSFFQPWYVYQRYIKDSMPSKVFSTYFTNNFEIDYMEIAQLRVMRNGNLFTRTYYQKTGCHDNECQQFLSASGLCFTFNGLRHEDIYRNNVVTSVPMKDYSYHNSDSDVQYLGKNFTLENMIYHRGNITTTPTYMSKNDVIMFGVRDQRTYRNTDICLTDDKIKGYLSIHNPIEIPFTLDSQIPIEDNVFKHITVIPKLVTSEKGLEKYEPSIRGCFYAHENQLSMFKHYSEMNCEAECAANCSLLECGCVPHHLPRHNTSVDVCITKCLFAMCDCGCLPDCNSLSYDFEVNPIQTDDLHQESLFMNFKGTRFYDAKIRASTTNLTQFLAYSISIVAVFNGFNLMVVFELFYFLTLRLWSYVKGYNN